jgi:hypothetical protein
VSTPSNQAYSIDSTTILQVDAAVIVGVFVLLTLTGIAGLTAQNQNTTSSQTISLLLGQFEGLIKIGLTTSIVIPFSLSAIFVMTASIYGRYGPRLIWFGKFCMIAGFTYIIGGMIVLLVWFFVGVITNSTLASNT